MAELRFNLDLANHKALFSILGGSTKLSPFYFTWGLAVIRQLGSRESTALGVGVPLPISPYEKLFVVLAIGHCSQYHPVTNVFSSGSSGHVLLCPTLL